MLCCHQMAGVERMLKYAAVAPEAPVMTSTRPSVVWPQYGIVTLEGVTLQHSDEQLRVLRNMWCCFRAEEKVRGWARREGVWVWAGGG